jgi:hypothetical protein
LADNTRSSAERRATRLDHLRQLTAKHQARDVTAALRAEWSEGRKPERIYLRRSFARLDKPIMGAFSDRKLPPRKMRPPATRLIAPRGVTLQTFLTVLFVAQCGLAPGKHYRTRRRVVPRPKDDSGRRPWPDLIAAAADHRPGPDSYLSSEDNRLRQIKSALNRLASDDIRLVEFPNANALSAKYEGFRLLEESGRLDRASRVRYTVPEDGEDVLGIPSTFFTNGWHLALTNSEIALLLALWSERGVATAWQSGVLVRLDGETRIRRYCLSPDAYASHKYLDSFGILEVVPDPNRRADGTYEDYSDGLTPIPHAFRIKEEGFDREGIGIVMATLKGRGRGRGV